MNSEDSVLDFHIPKVDWVCWKTESHTERITKLTQHFPELSCSFSESLSLNLMFSELVLKVAAVGVWRFSMKLSGSHALTLFLLNLIILVCILIKVLMDSQDRVCLVGMWFQIEKNFGVCFFCYTWLFQRIALRFVHDDDVFLSGKLILWFKHFKVFPRI